jgi:hypothetical protein
MKVLVKAIVTGFGLSVGAFVFRKLSERYNLEPVPTPAPVPPIPTPDVQQVH